MTSVSAGQIILPQRQGEETMSSESAGHIIVTHTDTERGDHDFLFSRSHYTHTQRQSEETMISGSAGHSILTPTQLVRWPARGLIP